MTYLSNIDVKEDKAFFCKIYIVIIMLFKDRRQNSVSVAPGFYIVSKKAITYFVISVKSHRIVWVSPT